MVLCTVVVWLAVAVLAWLSWRFTSLVSSDPFAKGELTCNTNVLVPPVPGVKSPKDQVTSPPAVIPPPLADTKVVSAGIVDVIVAVKAVSLAMLELL